MLRGNYIIDILTGEKTALQNTAILLLRGIIGIILFVVGAGKVFGWFHGFGLEKTVQMFSQTGIPVIWIYVSCFTEFLGGALLTLGFLTRPVSFAIVINMAVATIISLPGGFLGPNGAMVPLVFLICSIVVMLTGPKAYSLDHWLFG